MSTKKDLIRPALERVSEAANILAIHGNNGYSVESGALDTVFLRALSALKEALMIDDDNVEWYDPYGDIYVVLSEGLK